MMEKSGPKAMPDKKSRSHLFDLFLGLLLILAVLSVYFTFFRPVQFSRMIHREDVKHYAEIEILLPDDLSWMKGELRVGEESRNVFGELDWVVTGIGEETIAERKWVLLTVKILVVEKDSGIIRYGKYTLAKGSKIFLINDRYLLEGRILRYHLLDRGVLS